MTRAQIALIIALVLFIVAAIVPDQRIANAGLAVLALAFLLGG